MISENIAKSKTGLYTSVPLSSFDPFHFRIPTCTQSSIVLQVHNRNTTIQAVLLTCHASLTLMTTLPTWACDHW